MFSLFGGSPVVRRKTARRKSVRRKATKRKATKRKATRRKATKRKAQKKRVAKGRKRFVYGGSPTEQEPTEQELREQLASLRVREEALRKQIFDARYLSKPKDQEKIDRIQSELISVNSYITHILSKLPIKETDSMGDFSSSGDEFDGGSPFRKPGDPVKEFQGFARTSRVGMFNPEGVLTTNEVLTRTTDGPPPTIPALTGKIIVKFFEGGGIGSIDDLLPLLEGDFSQIPIESVILMLKSYILEIKGPKGKASIGDSITLLPPNIRFLERLIGVLTQLQPEVEAAKAAAATTAATTEAAEEDDEDGF